MEPGHQQGLGPTVSGMWFSAILRQYQITCVYHHTCQDWWYLLGLISRLKSDFLHLIRWRMGPLAPRDKERRAGRVVV